MAVIQITCRERKPGPFPANRVCADPDCTTYLNRWHGGDRCYQHAPAKTASLAEQRESFQDLMRAA